TWSRALLEVAKKIRPESPETVTTADVDKWIENKRQAESAKSAPSPEPQRGTEGKSEESRIGGKAEHADIFEMDEGDLRDLLDERFGNVGATEGELAAGRPGAYSFPNYDAFKKWMDARYDERDLEGMKLAFA